MAIEITTTNPQIVKALKNILQAQNLLDKSQKITRDGSNFRLISRGQLSTTAQVLQAYSDEISFVIVEDPIPVLDGSLQGTVTRFLEEHLGQESLPLIQILVKELPKKWSLYPPMVLFSAGFFETELWVKAFESLISKEEFFKHIRVAFPGICTHFATNKPIIEEDVMRRPFNLVPLSGDFGPEPTPQLYSDPSASDLNDAFWCTVYQNGIHQTWAPRYTMFSRGNIKEKKRILDTCKNLEGETVLDLYAGIGYFTLSYLLNGASVFCWEINPWSVEGLVRGLQRNGHRYKVFAHDEVVARCEIELLISQGYRAFVFHESNEFASQRLLDLGISDIAHINLGLLPSLKPSWPIARLAAQASGKATIVHAHENVHKDKFSELTEEVEKFFSGSVTWVEKVKTFAPDVWHVVLDVAV